MAAERKTIRWSLNSAAQEFPINRATLDKNIRQQDIQHGKDQKYSTAQICQAIFGDMDGEKLRLVREQADKHYLDNQRTKELLVERPKVGKFLERTFVALRQKILASSLTNEEQDELMLDLASLGKSDWAQAVDEPMTI